MRKAQPDRALLAELVNALDCGWKSGEATCELDSRVKFAGKTWQVTRRIGRQYDGLEAGIHFFHTSRRDLSRNPELPTASELASVNKMTQRLRALGYEGSFEFGRGGPEGMSGYFTKDLRTMADLRRARLDLERLDLGNETRRRA